MGKIIRLTESELTRLIKRMVTEMEDEGSLRDADKNWKSNKDSEETFSSFDDENWYDDEDISVDFDTEDFDEEEFDDFDKYSKKYPKQSLKKFGKGPHSKSMFDTYRDKKGPMKVRRKRFDD